MDECHKHNVRQKEPDARSVQFYIKFNTNDTSTDKIYVNI